MKNATLKKSNIVISRLKETLEGILSMFNEITTLDNEIILPDELNKSLQHLDESAKDFEINGIRSSEQVENTNTKTSEININKPTRIITRPVEKTETLTKNSKEIEKGEDR